MPAAITRDEDKWKGALATVWKKGEIEALSDRTKTYGQAVSLRLLVLLNHESDWQSQ